MLAGGSCRETPDSRHAAPRGKASGPALFEDVTASTGISFHHFTGARGEKYLPETLGSGVCAFDYDGDHRTDLYFVNGAPLPGPGGPGGPTNRLYRNRGDGGFEDVTAVTGTGDPGYGIACAAGDVDGDGWIDLFVANFGPDVLYRNRGNGAFEIVTPWSGTGDPSFSTGATFVDVEADGDLDLLVVNYLDYRLENNKYCGELRPGYRAYCGPEMYPGAPNRLYRNDGKVRFTDVSESSGIALPDGRGLGVLALDHDGDGDQDLFVANDGMANFLFRNDGSGRFRETGLLAGAALGDDGTPRAGMGVDFADYDGDGWLDLFVANLSFQPSALYRNNGDGTFSERSFTAGLAGPTHLLTGYGAGFFDFDNDGLPDLYQVNGSMLDNVELYYDNVTYAEPTQVFRNRGDGTFVEIAAEMAPDLAIARVGRGSATLDFDGDGDLDLVVVVAGGKARLFRNRGVPGRHWIGVSLAGVRSNRNGFGAKVILTAAGKIQTQQAKSASGYASQSESTLHFGLGEAARVDRLEVRWPSGEVDVISEIGLDGVFRVVEGSGKAERVTPGR